MASRPAVVDESAARSLGEGLFAQMSRQFPDMTDVLWLVKEGASLTITDKDGMTPLLRAMSWGNRAVISEMVNHGGDVNYAGGRQAVTAMQIAASGGDATVVQLMLDAGGDVLKRNAAGTNALEIARKRSAPDALALIEAAAKTQQAALDATEGHKRALNEGLPVEKPFRPMKRLTLRPR